MIDISVVIPTFRRQTQLIQAIDSVLAQNVSLEIIVVDDSPEGSARETVERYNDPRVSYVKREPPSRGKPALVRNSGGQLAQGRFVHFLDDDDRVAAGYYQTAIHTFNTHPHIGVVFGRIEPFTDDAAANIDHEMLFFTDAARRANLASRSGSRHWLVANLLFKHTVLVNSACMIRREHITTLGGYDDTLGLNEDVDFYCRAVRRFGFRFINSVVLHYRINADSLMHGRSDDSKLIDAYQKMYARYRATHGAVELLALKLFARTVLKVL